MSYPQDYHVPPNQYCETPNTRKRPGEHVAEDNYKRNNNDKQFYNLDSQNASQQPIEFPTQQQWNDYTYNNQITPENSWYQPPGSSNYHANDSSHRRTPPQPHNPYSSSNDMHRMQTPANYANGNNTYQQSLFYTPDTSDTSSNNSQYFGAPITAEQYNQHLKQNNQHFQDSEIQQEHHEEHQQEYHQEYHQEHHQEYHQEHYQEQVVAPPESNQLAPIPFLPLDENLLEDLSFEDIEMIEQIRLLEEEIQKPQPYHHRPMPNDDFVLDTVDGRLPVLLESSRYNLKVEEIRRRLGAPEYINKTCLFNFFRISKQKDGGREILRMLESHGLSVRTGQRHRPETLFSWLLEREAIHLAENFSYMYIETFPIEMMAWKVLETFGASGASFESCQTKAMKATMLVERVLSFYKDTQPKVTDGEEKYLGTRFDHDFATLSLLTHGFLHPHSITNFSTLVAVLEKTSELAEKVHMGVRDMRVFTPLEDGEKPFKIMSDDLFKYWNDQKHCPPEEITEECPVDDVSEELCVLENEVADTISPQCFDTNIEEISEGDESDHLDPAEDSIMFENCLKAMESEEVELEMSAEMLELEDELELMITENSEVSVCAGTHDELENIDDSFNEYLNDAEFLETQGADEVVTSVESLMETVKSANRALERFCEQGEENLNSGAVVVPPVHESLHSFVPPSDEALLEMTQAQLEALPVPEGEESSYWHDKALFAMYEVS